MLKKPRRSPAQYETVCAAISSRLDRNPTIKNSFERFVVEFRQSGWETPPLHVPEEINAGKTQLEIRKMKKDAAKCEDLFSEIAKDFVTTNYDVATVVIKNFKTYFNNEMEGVRALSEPNIVSRFFSGIAELIGLQARNKEYRLEEDQPEELQEEAQKEEVVREDTQKSNSTQKPKRPALPRAAKVHTESTVVSGIAISPLYSSDRRSPDL